MGIDRTRKRARSNAPPISKAHRKPYRGPEFRPYASLIEAILAGDAPCARALGEGRPEAWTERGCAAAYVAGFTNMRVESSIPTGQALDVYRAAREASIAHCMAYVYNRTDMPYVG